MIGSEREMMFKKYTHIVRFGHDEVEGIEDGTCYVFPKLDGANASIWFERSTRKRVYKCQRRCF